MTNDTMRLYAQAGRWVEMLPLPGGGDEGRVCGAGEGPTEELGIESSSTTTLDARLRHSDIPPIVCERIRLLNAYPPRVPKCQYLSDLLEMS